MTIIKVHQLQKHFKNNQVITRAVNGVNFMIEEGCSYAIIGPSGCGKTTLINMIGGLLKPSSGEVLIFNENIFNKSDEEQAQYRNSMFGYIMQDFALIEEETVLKNCEIPLFYSQKFIRKKERIKIIEEKLDVFGLKELINKKVKYLSGGEKQRVALARAIVNDSKILLADEPTGSLDQINTEIIINYFMDLKNKGKTIILVTHDHAVANSCDFIINMVDGKIIEN